jgi:hypothetical protein
MITSMPERPDPIEIDEARRLELLQEMLREVSSAVQDLRDDVLFLCERSRRTKHCETLPGERH